MSRPHSTSISPERNQKSHLIHLGTPEILPPTHMCPKSGDDVAQSAGCKQPTKTTPPPNPCRYARADLSMTRPWVMPRHAVPVLLRLHLLLLVRDSQDLLVALPLLLAPAGAIMHQALRALCALPGHAATVSLYLPRLLKSPQDLLIAHPLIPSPIGANLW